MPPNRYSPPNMAGPSRKRSHAQITRSESRSQSPTQPSSKRQRTSVVSYNTSRTTVGQPSPTVQLPVLRYPGDGFDYRSPIMPTTSAHFAPTMIDLTTDDTTPPATTGSQVVGERLRSQEYSRSPDSDATYHMAPQSGSNIISETVPEIIDLLQEESDGSEPRQTPEGNGRSDQTRRANPIGSASPDVTFVSSRPAPAHTAHGMHQDPEMRHLPVPWSTGYRGTLPFMTDFLRRGARFIFPEAGAEEEREQMLDQDILNQIDGIPNPDWRIPLENHTPPPVVPNLRDYGDIALDYGQPAFTIGRYPYLGGLRATEGRSSTPPEIVQEPYQKPATCKEPFSRDLEREEIVLICPSCKEELAIGDTELKRQVWIAKQCGHVYCGQCVADRPITKGGNRKDKQRASTGKTLHFKTCMAPGCTKIVSHKSTLFQIYL